MEHTKTNQQGAQQKGKIWSIKFSEYPGFTSEETEVLYYFLNSAVEVRLDEFNEKSNTEITKYNYGAIPGRRSDLDPYETLQKRLKHAEQVFPKLGSRPLTYDDLEAIMKYEGILSMDLSPTMPFTPEQVKTIWRFTCDEYKTPVIAFHPELDPTSRYFGTTAFLGQYYLAPESFNQQNGLRRFELPAESFKQQNGLRRFELPVYTPERLEALTNFFSAYCLVPEIREFQGEPKEQAQRLRKLEEERIGAKTGELEMLEPKLEIVIRVIPEMFGREEFSMR